MIFAYSPLFYKILYQEQIVVRKWTTKEVENGGEVNLVKEVHKTFCLYIKYTDKRASHKNGKTAKKEKNYEKKK